MDDFNNSSVRDQNMTRCDPVEKESHPFLALGYSLLFLVGLTLNCFTLWFHCRGAHGQVSKNWMIYLKHLTAADFMLCLSLPLRIIHYTSTSLTIHMVYCSFGTTLMILNMNASVLFMGYIAANRYMKIFYSSGSHFLMTAKASHIISITTWVVLLTTTTPLIIQMLTLTPCTSVQNTCYHLIHKLRKPEQIVISISVNTFIFLLVLCSLVFFYYSTSRRVQQIQQRQLASSNSKKLVKSRRNMLVLVSVFCFCFVPYHVIRIPAYLLGGRCSVVWYYVKEVAVFISVFNICLDPLIYVFLCEDFRAQLKQLFNLKGKRNTSPLEAGHSRDHLNTKSSQVLEGTTTSTETTSPISL
ncbi:P2Y purinoceptor 14-like [Fundulus heteroclitus]|uniref:P2Y purinoceptor 14-like n=1 Tax=Fundulus heteroclitus TaxID=8078 RepID=UPI00165BFFCA|nr:P2Y purinoceptor 14-like [Fundulus heteroclitus]